VPGRFACLACDARADRWSTRCGKCGAIETITRGAELADRAPRSRPVLLSTVAAIDPPRYTTGRAAWDLVLGGGVVAPSAIIVTGPPGVGKSTKLLHVAGRLARELDGAALFLSAEMPVAMVAAAARRIGADLARIIAWEVSDVDEAAARIAHDRPRVVVWDSASVFRVGGARGEQATESAILRAIAAGRAVGAVSWIVLHVTKEGRPAGLHANLHHVDADLRLARGKAGRPLCRVTKNRFGPAPLRAVDAD